MRIKMTVKIRKAEEKINKYKNKSVKKLTKM